MYMLVQHSIFSGVNAWSLSDACLRGNEHGMRLTQTEGGLKLHATVTVP